MKRAAKPIRDKVTGATYPSEGAAGRDLGPILVPEARQNNWVWFAIYRAFPDRFQTMVDGEWRDYAPSNGEMRSYGRRASRETEEELRKFSVTYHLRSDSPPIYYLIEAVDRDHAGQILEEELGPSRLERDERIEWSTHEQPEWRSAWRHRSVLVLKATTIPEGVE